MNTMIDYLKETVKKFPNKNAFVDDKRAITFAELDKETKCVAQCLIDMNYRKIPTVIFLEKSVECVNAYLGVARSGNFSAMMDLSMPNERILKVFREVNPKLIITDAMHLEIINKLVENKDIKILLYEDAMKVKVDEKKLSEVESTVTAKDIIVLIYTSGSTGIPKGVIIPHSFMNYYIDWQVKRLPITSDLVCGDLIPMYYSLGQWYVTMTLVYGITTYLIPQKLIREPAKLMQYLYDNKVSMFVWVPMMFAAVSECGCLDKPYLPELKIVLFCGEAMPAKIMNNWRKYYKNTRFFCMYGTSECIDSELLFEVKKDYDENSLIPIGNYDDSANVILVNNDGIRASKNELAELHFQIFDEAYGYYNDLFKTDESFVTNPIDKNDCTIYFKSGDIVKINDIGEIEYVSRKDSQIKFMGNRINLGEIEAATISIEAIEKCMATFDNEKKRICLCYIGNIEEKEVISIIEKLIPNYMMPKKVVRLENMPLLLNGKLDRIKLKELMNS